VATTLAEVLQHFGPRYLRSHAVSGPQARAWRAIVACRTPALGGGRLRCDGRGAQQWRWHSCRNRHCPRCQNRDRDAWTSARVAELLDVPYCHLVFTLPHELNRLAAVHARWVYDTLMRCTAATLTEFAANPRWLGGIGAFTLVLHTWTQDLRRHLHMHALMACGALQLDAEGGDRWRAPRRAPGFLFPVHALSRVFRGKFLQALHQAAEAGTLARDPACTEAAQQQRLQALRRHRQPATQGITACIAPAMPAPTPLLRLPAPSSCKRSLPEHPAETYTAHPPPCRAVQSNEVYLTPCTSAASFSFASASDKRYSLAAIGRDRARPGVLGNRWRRTRGSRK
jgi:hypothetical protein